MWITFIGLCFISLFFLLHYLYTSFNSLKQLDICTNYLTNWIMNVSFWRYEEIPRGNTKIRDISIIPLPPPPPFFFYTIDIFNYGTLAKNSFIISATGWKSMIAMIYLIFYKEEKYMTISGFMGCFFFFCETKVVRYRPCNMKV